MAKEVSAKDIEDAVHDACIEASIVAGDDLLQALEQAVDKEESEVGKMVLGRLLENCEVAREERLPICQDTGLAVFFVELGEGVAIVDGSLGGAINAGMKRGYADGNCRKSTCNCLTRKNFGDNTPAVIHYNVVPGDGLEIAVMAKGGGSENMSAVGMLKPAQGWEGIKGFVVDTVERAGANPCPPVIVGVGIGGSYEKAALNSKKSLLRHLDEPNPYPEIAAMEDELLELINNLGIGPQGYGGRVSALGVNIIMHPCHIASLPVAVNIQCHASRHRVITL